MADLYFPAVIDNTMRKEFVKCEKINHWKFERGLNAEIGNEHLIAGGAFAKGMEVMRRAYFQLGNSEQIATVVGIQALYEQYGNFVPPASSYKTVDRMAGALTFYAGRVPMSQDEFKPIEFRDGKLGIEMSFNYEIPVAHPVTGLPLTYCGRFDMLGLDKAGRAWVIDEKTTGRMGDAWAHQWDLDSQMTGYVWGAQKLLHENNIDIEVVGAVINGISILKYDYDHMRCPTFRQPWEVERWYKQMLRDVTRWTEAYKLQDHNQVLDHACALYNNPCQYAKLCKSANPERIEGTYTVKFWNPLDRD